MYSKLEIHEFFVEGSDSTLSHVLLHIAEPMTDEERELGTFFALADITNPASQQVADIQQIIEHIEQAYYDTTDQSPEKFEAILQDINRSHQTLLVDYDESPIDCVVGVISDRKIILGYHGKPTAMLMYQSGNTMKQTPIIDIAEENKQLFSAVIEGQVNIGDTIYIATPHTEDYYDASRVRKYLFGKTSKDTAMHIQKVLDNMAGEVSFGGMLLYVGKMTVQNAPSRQKRIMHAQGSQESMDNLLHTARTTEETMSPPLLKNIVSKAKESIPRKKQVRRPNKRRGGIETNRRRGNVSQKETAFQKFLILLGSALVFLARSIMIGITKLLKIVSWIFTYLYYLITNRDGKRTQIHDTFRTYIMDRVDIFKRMNLVTKIILIALIALAIIFVGSVSYIKAHEKRDAEIAQYETWITQAKDDLDEAQARLLYGEEKLALEHIVSAENILQNIDDKNELWGEQKQFLLFDIETLRQRVQKITVVDPELLLTLENTKVDGLTALGSTLIAYGADDQTMYAINPVTKEITRHAHETHPPFVTADAPKEEDFVSFITPSAGMVYYNPETQSFRTPDISYPAENTKIIDLAVYNRRIYTLSPDAEQIYKHDPTQTGYARGTAWIDTKSSNLSNAVSIAVDGDVYVLTSDGSIRKFYAGDEEDFAINGLDPALEKPTKLWTYAEYNNIYILEPKNNRLVVVDKKGRFIGLYTSESWNNPTGFVVSSDERTAYILDDNTIYTFSL